MFLLTPTYSQPIKTTQTQNQAIAFCADVAHARALALAFDGEGIPAAVVHGAMDAGERREVLGRFRDGGFGWWWVGGLGAVVRICVFTETYTHVRGASCPHQLWRLDRGVRRAGVRHRADGAPNPLQRALPPGNTLKVFLSLVHTYRTRTSTPRPIQNPTPQHKKMLGRAARPDVPLPADAPAAERRRLIRASRKPHMRVIDVVDNLKRHAEAAAPVTLPSLLALPPAFDMMGASLDGVLRELKVRTGVGMDGCETWPARPLSMVLLDQTDHHKLSSFPLITYLPPPPKK